MMAVLLGEGLRLFENIDIEHIELESIKVIDSTPERIYILFSIV
jgi:hypothetical protein